MKKTRLIDISHTISSESTVYPGDDQPSINSICEIAGSCPCKITSLGLTTHLLTHVDPPAHFVLNGKTLDDIPLNRFVTTVSVIEVQGDFVSSQDVLNSNLREGDSIIFKTKNSYKWTGIESFDESHAFISKDAADCLAKNKVNLVGFDYVSIDEFGNEDYPAHKALLGADVIVLEGLALSNVLPGNYQLSALPLKIKAGDGAPVRAVLYPLESA